MSKATELNVIENYCTIFFSFFCQPICYGIYFSFVVVIIGICSLKYSKLCINGYIKFFFLREKMENFTLSQGCEINLNYLKIIFKFLSKRKN